MLAVVRCGLTSSPRRLVQPNRDRPAERLASHLWPLPLENVTDGAAPSRPEPAFADLGLGDAVMKALKDVGYETPSAIQAATIPPLLAGRDVVGDTRGRG